MKVPPVMTPGEERIAGRGADAGGGVPISEAHPFAGELIEVWGGDFALRIVASEIANPQVVGLENENFPLFLGCQLAHGREQGERGRERGREEGVGPVHRGTVTEYKGTSDNLIVVICL